MANPHPGRGRPFEPGNNANPSGRPKGFGHLIREQTKEGQELVDFALSVLRGKRNAKLQLRMEALTWLSDRGWGRPAQPIEGGDEPIRIILTMPGRDENA